MDMNNNELAKSLVSLIDETLEEIEELKKSKFSAAEIKIEGPGEGVAGKPANGELDAKKAEKKEEDDEEKEEEKKPFEKKEEKEEDEEKKEDEIEKGVLDEAEKEKPKKELLKEEKEEEKEEIKKSEEITEELMKSYIDTKISPLENKLSTIIDMVNKIADQPVERKSVAAGEIVPLKKNNEEVETLSKSDITNKLFELKKSGTKVDSLDMVKAELGTEAEATIIANKYGLK